MTGKLACLCLGMILAGTQPALAQNYPPPLAAQPGGPPILMQQAPPDPRQFCYYNGQPYSLGSPYPGEAQGPGGQVMRCRESDAPINGYIILQWGDAN